MAATVCEWCGRDLPPVVVAAPPPPLSFASPPMVQTLPSATPAPTPPTISPGPIVAVVLVVLFLFIVVVAAMSAVPSPPQLPGPGGYSPPPIVNVVGVVFQSTDNACGLGGASAPGFVTFAGSNFVWNWTIFSGTSCRISTVSTATPGFQVIASDVPLSMAAGAGPLLTVTLTTPGGGFSGTLFLDVE